MIKIFTLSVFITLPRCSFIIIIIIGEQLIERKNGIKKEDGKKVFENRMNLNRKYYIYKLKGFSIVTAAYVCEHE